MPGEGELRLREASADDAAAIAGLCAQLGYSTTEEHVRARLGRLAEAPEHHVIVADAGGDVVGFAGLLRAWTVHSDEISVRLSSLVVDASCRGRGIGAALVAASEAWAREQGATSLHLTSGSHRPEAHRFYEKLGYRGDGVRFRRTIPPG